MDKPDGFMFLYSVPHTQTFWTPAVLQSRLACSQKVLFVRTAVCKLSFDSSLQSCFLFSLFLFHVHNIYSLQVRARNFILRIILPLTGWALSRRDGWHCQRSLKPLADGSIGHGLSYDIKKEAGRRNSIEYAWISRLIVKNLLSISKLTEKEDLPLIF
jgi:hypothetical protein